MTNAKPTNKPAAPQQTAPAPTPAPPTRYRVVAPKRPLTGTKHGGGTAATHQKLADEATKNGGFLTYAQASQICKDAGDPGFAAYAVRRLKVLVAEQPAK